jgi:hypothetical protein
MLGSRISSNQMCKWVLSGIIFVREDYQFRVEKGRSTGNVGQIRRELADAETRS